MAEGNKLQGAFFALLGGVCWGMSGSVGQYLFTVENMDSTWLVPIRLGLAGIIMLSYYSFHHGKEVFSPWRRKEDAKELLIYGLLGVSGCQFTYFLTIQLSSAAIGTILQNISPIFILLYSCFKGHRAPKSIEIICIVLALLGVVLIASHGDPENLITSGTALLSGSISAICVAVYTLAPVNIMKKYPIALMQGWAFLMGGILFSLLFHPWTYDYVPGFFGILGILFVVLVGNIAAFSSFMYGIRIVGPSKANLYSFAEPITAAIIGITLFHNPFTIADCIGFICVFVMLILISK